jgi:hypothetical protein
MITWLSWSSILLSVVLGVVGVWANKPDYPLLLVSFDGFQNSKFNEFIENYPRSNFARFAKSSLRAEWLKPSFPSVTFR